MSIVIITANFRTGGTDYEIGQRFIHHKEGRNDTSWVAITNEKKEFSATIPRSGCVVMSTEEAPELEMTEEKLKKLG
jgi:hypothetical protein